jgi:predicted RNA-binding protein with PUA-like domain
MNYWLMKSEPDDVSVDDAIAAPKQTVAWTGVRGWQARNYMRNDMKVGDGVLFYHSSCPQPGIVGIAKVVSEPYPDPTQFDKKHRYYDPKSSPEKPRWYLVDVQVVEKIPIVSLAEMRERPELADMIVLRRGNRLSITPVEPKHWKALVGKDKP